MTKVVVLGGSGFLGSHVVDSLLDNNYDVTIADLKPSKYHPELSFQCCDILDPAQLEQVLDGVEVVYNFAGLADIDYAYEHPGETLEANIIGNHNVLAAARKCGVKRYIYASSAYALSNKGSFYGISKLASEKVIEEYHARYGLDYTILRYGSLYSERAGKDNFIYKLIYEALHTGKIVLKGTGEEVREYIHAADAGRISVAVLQDNSYINEHLLITGQERLSRMELYSLVQEIFHGKVELDHVVAPFIGHYKTTPYSHHPSRGRKIIPREHIDLGQGIISVIEAMDKTIDPETATL